MDIGERTVGDFCIYGAALKVDDGDYIGAVVVRRLGQCKDTLRRDKPAQCTTFDTASAALVDAMAWGEEALRLRHHVLAGNPFPHTPGASAE